MRKLPHTILVAVLGVMVAALLAPSLSHAAPKKTPPKTPAGSNSSSGDIDFDQPAGSAAPAGSASGTPSGATNPADIDMDADQGSGTSDLAADLAAVDQGSAGPVKAGEIKKTPVSWQDITVVIRKPFLKLHRVELFPMVGVTMNDNIIRHYSEGGELNYWLTDVLAIGVEGQYYEHDFESTYDLVARQARRLPTVNQYNWSAALDFHYVPVYGKFAVFDHRLVTWEAFFTAGIGAGQSQVVPRDPEFPGFTNLLIQPNLGVGMRFFLAKWLTINIGVRDYAFEDKFEPTDREAPPAGPNMMGVNATAAQAQANATSEFINNIMFQIGVAFWIPGSFEYTTFR
jgi:outer membrane beta-barrel protein